MSRMRKQSDAGEQRGCDEPLPVPADAPPQPALTKGMNPLKDPRDEEFCQRFTKGENPYDLYHQLWPTVPERLVIGAATKRMRSCQDRIDYLLKAATEEERRWTTWTKEESTKELKHIVHDPDATNAIRIKAITELNTMYQHNNPKAAGLTIQNRGIVFMARDGITLSQDFLKEAKDAIAQENQRFVDVTPEEKKGGGDGKQG